MTRKPFVQIPGYIKDERISNCLRQIRLTNTLKYTIYQNSCEIDDLARYMSITIEIVILSAPKRKHKVWVFPCFQKPTKCLREKSPQFSAISSRK